MTRSALERIVVPASRTEEAAAAKMNKAGTNSEAGVESIGADSWETF
jgi:hypothetical protein